MKFATSAGPSAWFTKTLSRSELLDGSRDFETLGSLIIALERIASLSLQRTTSEAAEVDLMVLLDEFRIVIIPLLDEDEIAAQWQVEEELPLVCADRSGLMQVFLNLVTNSIRALTDREQRTLCITVRRQMDRVLVEFDDNGPGLAHPEMLFQPFQPGAKSTGLGLYLSRAMLHSFGGEIRYQASSQGAHFVVALALVERQSA